MTKLKQPRVWIAIGVVQCTLCTSAALAQTFPYRLGGTYSIEAAAFDGDVTPAQDTLVTDLAPVTNNVVDASSNIAAPVDQSNSFANLTMHAQVGMFKINTAVDATSARTPTDNPPGGVAAFAGIATSLFVTDDFTLHSKIPGTKIINSKWNISGDLTATAIGFKQSVPGAFDYVQSTAQSWVNLTGTGVAPGPYSEFYTGLAQFPAIHPSLYGVAYREQGGTDPPTIDDFQRDPGSFIPISFEIIPEKLTGVDWTFEVGSTVSVFNSDLTPGAGQATSTANFSHTLAWGGITSVIDEATGEPITDWTLESLSGFDYTNAIPEPSAFLLAILAAGLVVLSSRRAPRLF